MSEKTCRLCGDRKPLDAFYRASSARDGRRGECISCYRTHRAERYAADPEFRERALARVKAWQAANPEKTAANRRRWAESGRKAVSVRRAHLKRAYGITLEVYEELLVAHGGGCAICGAPPPPGQSLHVDHDHGSGRIRGLLCFTCNAGIGLLGEDPDRLTRAAAYLAREGGSQG